MARLPRLTLPAYPHHVIQRGNNRQPIFRTDADRSCLLDLLHDSARKFDVAIHAYVLMENHFHLLVTPQTAEGLPALMQAAGRSYVRYFNDLNKRSGTLWEGRYRSTVIQPDRYLLACMAYIDLNPVRWGLVAEARDYAWSSHCYHAGLLPSRLVTPHRLYWALGNTPFAREAAYAELVHVGLSATLQSALTQSVLNGWVLGDEAFVDELQKLTSRRLVKLEAGRPSKAIL